MSTYADDLCDALIAVALFDREITIRRAASAAFQELVGRLVGSITSLLMSSNNLGQDLFANGIPVLQEMNFFTVTLRQKAYQIVAPALTKSGHPFYCEVKLIKIFRFPSYARFIVTHLYKVSLVHWDSEVRQLAADSLVRCSIGKEELKHIVTYMVSLTDH